MSKCSVVLLSGGLDSAANLAFAREKGRVVLALTARYGQKAAESEVRAARQLCRHFDIRHEVVDLDWLGVMGGSSLTENGKSVPELERSDLDNLSITQGTAKSVWVPNRNGVLINVGAAYAERFGAEQVVVGFNREEATTFPDNSGAFLELATKSLTLSTATQVEVACYTTDLNKVEIVRELKELKAPFPFKMLWSCYYGGKLACGTCESCQRLARAMSEA